MTGSNHFSINRNSEDFKRSFKKLTKATAKRDIEKLIETLEKILIALIENPRPQHSRQEPSPKRISLPPLHEFRKIEFTIAKGAAGQIRLMYLLDIERQVITALWIYSHEQFAKRPPDGDIKQVIEAVFSS